MSELTLQSWEREFRRYAKADKLAAMREHLRRLNLPDKPEMILEGTIQVVQACLAYLNPDGRSYVSFLAIQTYDPARSPGVRCALTFDLPGKAFDRVLVERNAA